MRIVKLLGVSIFSIYAAIAHSDTIDNAYRVCDALDNMEILSQPCELSVWNKSVDATLSMSSSEAIKLCKGLSVQIAQEGMMFDKGWSIRLFSPYSGDKSIATCKLPN